MKFELDGQSADISLLVIQQMTTRMRKLSPVELLQAISVVMASLKLDATITAAWQVLKTIEQAGNSAKEKIGHYAEIAYWYKIDPFSLTEIQQMGLLGNLDKMKSQEIIFKGDYDPADYNGIYQLYQAAYDDEDLAQEMKTQAFQKFVEQLTTRKN